ncbi:MAG: NADP-dependent malic enzyme [Ruminococcaceae bacterium]|nr:NADP-dependent malic enzyme [Oscillospiraceae bacterium]
MDIRKESLKKHYEWNGKIEVVTRCPLETREDMSLAYTPGVAEACLEIEKDINKSFELTRRNNLVAVITDGTAVLGLGDIGPEAGMPVMEGKCALFKAFADVDAFPLCVKSKDTDEIVKTISLISGSFGGINLEDISAPRCFEIEKKLNECCDIPIFHDDQHGTAVVVLAALLNALKVVKKDIETAKIVVNGLGAAGTAISKMLISAGAKNMVLVDKKGIIEESDTFLGEERQYLAKITNKENLKGNLSVAIKNADVFIGVSAPDILSEDMVKTMNSDSIVFAMANPTPEIMPDKAKNAGARIVGTGRSDFPNQINNVLVFPGIFRGALDANATKITENMKLASAKALAEHIPENELNEENIIPSALDKSIAYEVAKAVKEQAVVDKVVRI